MLCNMSGSCADSKCNMCLDKAHSLHVFIKKNLFNSSGVD